MFRLFRKQQEIGQGLLTKDVLADRIVNGALRLQRQWARWMDRWFGRLSVQSTKAVFIGFCIIGGGLSAYNVYRVLVPRSISVQYIPIQPLSTIKLPDHSKTFVDTSSAEQRLVQDYLDSLYQTASGRKVADSILLGYPGLAEHFYDSQKESLNLKNIQP